MNPPPLSPLAVVGLGGNVGDAPATIEQAMLAVASLPGVEVVGRSSLWRTTPVGGPPQPDYCNGAIGVRSPLSPHELMRHLLDIEARFGRTRGERNAPRTLDLDLLWIDGLVVESDELVVPHPRLRERAFALIPLLEVVGDARDPLTGTLYAVTLAELGTSGVHPID